MNIMDVSNLTSSYFNSASSLIGVVILIGIAAGVLAILFYVSGNIEKYKRFKKLFRFLYSCFSYCAYGMLTVAIIGVPVYFGYIGFTYAQDNPEDLMEFAKWTGVVVGAFVGFVFVGYCTKNRVWKRIFSYHKQVKDEAVYQELMDELPVEKGV